MPSPGGDSQNETLCSFRRPMPLVRRILGGEATWDPVTVLEPLLTQLLPPAHATLGFQSSSRISTSTVVEVARPRLAVTLASIAKSCFAMTGPARGCSARSE